MWTIDYGSKKEHTVVNRNVKSQIPSLIEESFALRPNGNVVELDGAVIVTDPNSGLDAGLIRTGEASNVRTTELSMEPLKKYSRCQIRPLRYLRELVIVAGQTDFSILTACCKLGVVWVVAISKP